MSNNGDMMVSFASLARNFLATNPDILDRMVEMLHNIADDMDKIKHTRMITDDKYMQPFTFKQRIIDIVIKKLGYSLRDIPDLCNQGRAHELLQEVEKMNKVSEDITPSRRLFPSSRRSIRPQIEDVSSK